MALGNGLVFEKVEAKDEHGELMLDGAVDELEVYRAWLGHGWLYLTARYGNEGWSQSSCFVPAMTDEQLAWAQEA